jgi:exoribonuclease R
MTSVSYLYQYKFSRLVRVHDAPNSEREAIWDDTAKHLAMYIFLDSASKPNPDLRTKWWEKMKDKPYYDVAGYIITNLKPSKEDE